MKKTILSTVILFIVCSARSQSTRYFEFNQPFESTTISFIVATSDIDVINSVLNEITLPIEDRRFISGNIASGDGGFNHNGANWYSWHFIENDWQLTSLNVEWCDGIAGFIGDNPDVIAGNTVYFCPWDSYPVQEVLNPELSTASDLITDLDFYPNPSSEKIAFEGITSDVFSICIYNLAGQRIFSTELSKRNSEVDVTKFGQGLYFLHIADGNKNVVKRLMITAG